MPSNRPAATIAVAVLLLTAGCIAAVQHWTLPASDQAAVERLDTASDAIQSQPGYTISIDGFAEAKRGEREASLDYRGSGAVNLTSRRAQLQTEGDGEADAVYLDGYRVYRPCWPFQSGNDATWYATELDRNRPWSSYAPVGSFEPLLEISRVFDRGTDRVDGLTTDVVTIRPNPRDFQSMQRRLPEQLSDREGQLIKNITVTVWISKSTDRPVQVRVDRRSQQGLFGAGLRQTVTYSITYEPTTVELPNRTVESEDAC